MNRAVTEVRVTAPGVVRFARGHGWALAFLMALVVSGLVLPVGWRSLVMVMMAYSIFALAYGVLLGYANQPSLGQSLFFGVGAYGLVLSLLRWHLGFWPGLGVALGAGAAAALLVGALAVRVSEDYHVIFTALVASVFHLLAQDLTSITGGMGGLPVPVPPIPLGPWRISVYDPRTNYYLMLGFAVAVYILLAVLVRSRLGRVWVALRENEARLPYLRYNTYFYKLSAFVLAGTLTALAGALYALRLRYASSEFFAFQWSLVPFVWVILGGMGTLGGPIIGVVLFTLFQYYISGWWTYYLILFGVAILLILRWAPRGVMGYLKQAEPLLQGRWRGGRG